MALNQNWNLHHHLRPGHFCATPKPSLTLVWKMMMHREGILFSIRSLTHRVIFILWPSFSQDWRKKIDSRLVPPYLIPIFENMNKVIWTKQLFSGWRFNAHDRTRGKPIIMISYPSWRSSLGLCWERLEALFEDLGLELVAWGTTRKSIGPLRSLKVRT